MNSQKLWLDLHKIMLAEIQAQMESPLTEEPLPWIGAGGGRVVHFWECGY